MGIGGGIVLVVIGAILVFALDFDLPGFSDDTLGVILMVAGVVVVLLVLMLQAQRNRTTRTTVRRVDDPPVL